MKKDIMKIIEAHEKNAKSPSKAVRKWDERTPYYTHPLWCAMTIAAETNLDEKTREEGIQALFYHDVLEDTTQELPEWLSENVKQLVKDMTFYGGSAEEQREVWSKSKEVKLYKLYDKVSNLLDADWMDDERKTKYPEYALRLCEEAEKNYKNLNITRIARAIVDKIKTERRAKCKI